MTLRSSRSFAPLVAMGIVVATGSIFVPLGYDEGNWLAVVRRVAAGESLYTDIMDNKPPAFFALVRGLDALPGSYAVARAAFIGILVVALGGAVRSLLKRWSWTEPAATGIGALLGLAGAMQATLVLNFELPAATLLIVGLSLLAGSRPVAGSMVASLAIGIDIRSIALIPGVVLFAFVIGRREGRIASLVAGGLSIAWIVAVLTIPDLRYSLIELNIATRRAGEGWSPAGQSFAVLRGMLLPVGIVLAFAGRSRSETNGLIRSSWMALLGAGSLVALSSLQPFDKYWSLALPGLVVLAASHAGARSHASPPSVRAAGAVAALGLLVSLGYNVSSNLDQARTVARYERAAHDLDRTLPTDAILVRFDTQPFLGTFLPRHDRMPAAVLDFLIADTSRRLLGERQLEDAISSATVMTDDGALSVDIENVLPPYRRLWRIFARHVDDFPCVQRFEGLTIRYRSSACPAR